MRGTSKWRYPKPLPALFCSLVGLLIAHRATPMLRQCETGRERERGGVCVDQTLPIPTFLDLILSLCPLCLFLSVYYYFSLSCFSFDKKPFLIISFTFRLKFSLWNGSRLTSFQLLRKESREPTF